jgi:NAD(P)-dependent dehydrogenase (short-subunit alcohol dehydrogenase family)
MFSGMSESFTGRTAVVTGGTGALGRAVVAALLARGAEVHVTWVVEREVAELREHLDGAARLRLHRADVTDAKAVEELMNDVAGAAGRLDVLANIVGGFAFGRIEETDPATWHRMLALNATSAFLSCRYAVPHMRARRWGRIVNVAAGPALGRGAAKMSAYAAAKSAVLNLTYSLSAELVGDGITVNAIVPSTIDTPANREAMPNADRSTWLDPAEMAEVVAYLVSDAGAIVTGTAVNLSRG